MDKKEKFALSGIILIAILVALSIYFSIGYSNFEMEVLDSEIKEVCFEEECFEVELAISLEERQKGLMYQKSLGERKGMLFVFEKSGIYNFWMKNTEIPLDIIWISENKEVVTIKENAEPCITDECPSYGPGKNSTYVLEVNSGISEEVGLEPGEFLEFK